jgi:hypothetical protein
VADLVALLTEDDNAKGDAYSNDWDQDEPHAAVECGSENVYPEEAVHLAQ